VLGHREFHRQCFAADAYARDGKHFSRGIVQTNAAEIHRKAFFHGSDDHLENAAEIQSFGNGTRDLIQETQTLQLGLEPFLRVLALFNFRFEGLDGSRQIFRSALHALIQFVVGSPENLSFAPLRVRHPAD
jgi:hypothetical protein